MERERERERERDKVVYANLKNMNVCQSTLAKGFCALALCRELHRYFLSILSPGHSALPHNGKQSLLAVREGSSNL